MQTYSEEQRAELASYLKGIKAGDAFCLPIEKVRELHKMRDEIALAALEAKPAAWRYRYNKGGLRGDWKLVDSEAECNPLPAFERQLVYTAPPVATSAALDSWIETLNTTIDWISALPWPTASAAKHGRLLYQLRDEIKNMDAAAPASSDDLVMLVRRLVRALKLTSPDHKLVKEAPVYMKRMRYWTAIDALRDAPSITEAGDEQQTPPAP